MSLCRDIALIIKSGLINIPTMLNMMLKKIPLFLLFFAITSFANTHHSSHLKKKHTHHIHHTHNQNQNSIWKIVAKSMNLKAYQHNEDVRAYVRWYLVHTKALYSLTKNAQPYIAYIIAELKKRGMPLELALLPMIESSYNPKLISEKGAVGLWQMMPTTARDLGIQMNWWYDGRLDIVASTHAALDYLQYLHDYFKSWPLTFAAYNSGIGTVQKAIQSNQALGLPITYRSLALPQQTKRYVPKIIALAMILSNPHHYNLPLHAVSNKQVFTSVQMRYPLTLKKVAKLAKCQLSLLRKLNPGFKHAKPAPSKIHYNLLIPTNRVETFNSRMTNYIAAAMIHKIKTNVYRVKPGDSLSTIAHKHKITLSDLRKTNHLLSDVILAGQSLYLPKK